MTTHSYNLFFRIILSQIKQLIACSFLLVGKCEEQYLDFIAAKVETKNFKFDTSLFELVIAHRNHLMFSSKERFMLFWKNLSFPVFFFRDLRF